MTEQTSQTTPPAEQVGDADKGKKVKLLPITLRKGYRPLDADEKLPAGTEIKLPADEARDIVKKGLAIRGDDF